MSIWDAKNCVVIRGAESPVNLVDCFSGVIAIYIALASKSVIDKAAYEELRSDIDNALADSLRLAIEHGKDIRNYDVARFALCSLIDEVLMTDFNGKGTGWRQYLLQESFYGISTAGVEFYRKLDEFQSNDIEIMEVYYLCLSLGFKGKFQSGVYAVSPERLCQDLYFNVSKKGIQPIVETQYRPKSLSDGWLRQDSVSLLIIFFASVVAMNIVMHLLLREIVNLNM